MRTLLALAGALLSVEAIQACDIVKDPRPSWEQMIDEEEIVFVGTVVAVVPAKPADGTRRAVFRVEIPAKGDIGTEARAVMDMNSCNRGFSVGDHVIFAGAQFETNDPQPAYMATDSGWDPTVYLDDPPNAEQLAQLDYVNKLAQEHAAKGATK